MDEYQVAASLLIPQNLSVFIHQIMQNITNFGFIIPTRQNSYCIVECV